MALIAVDQSASTTVVVSPNAYNSSYWYLGSLMNQNTGMGVTNNYISTFGISQAKPEEENVTMQLHFLDGISWSSRYDWIFGIENVTTGTVRRISAYLYDRTLQQYSWKGFITFTFNTAATNTNRGFRALYYTHTTGTVGVSGTAVTGTSTAFSTQRISVGARIAFGTTDPTTVAPGSWYYISAIGSDSSITLTGSAGTITSGTSYVIEELRFAVIETNSTTTNGGLFLGKGITWDDFSAVGTTIAASASTVDNLKLVYWLADAATITNVTAAGAAIDGNKQTSFTSMTHWLYVLDTAGKIFAYNLRAADTIAAGKMVLTAVTNCVITGVQAVTGTMSQANNGIVKTVSHSSGNGIKSLYFVTTSRIYRVAIANITSGNISWQSDSKVEVAVGGSTTMTATSTLAYIDYDSVTDSFIVLSTGATGLKSYYTKYPVNSGDQFQYFAFLDTKTFDGSNVDSRTPSLPYNTASTQIFTSCINGVTHTLRVGSATVGGTALFSIPFAAHWDFTTSTAQTVISPAISTPNINKYNRVVFYEIPYLGTGPFVTSLNNMRLSYRTAGISDNSGSWTLLSLNGDLSSVSGNSQIQFMFEFQMLGQIVGIPPRLLGFTVFYTDLSNDSHYQPSATLSDATNKHFTWRFSTVFGSTVPTLRVRLYDGVMGSLLVDDNTTTPSGTFEQSTNGGSSWTSWTNSDLTNNTTYLRYTPTSLADNIVVRGLLTLY